MRYALRRLLLLLATAGLCLQKVTGEPYEYTSLPPLPDPVGFAGMYAGATDRGIIVAGGHRFAGGVPWWEGGTKVWSDVIYTFDPAAGEWQTRRETLPRPSGDGVAVGWGDGLVCTGGGDSTQAHSDAFVLRWRDSRLETFRLPNLPTPTLRMGGALVGNVFYLAGGRDHPNSPSALHGLISLDLSKPGAVWKTHPAWPGPTRMMPVMAVAGDSLYLFGGIEIVPDAQGKPRNKAPYLSDAYRFTLVSGEGHWEKLANLPKPVAGAPSPAWLADDNTIVIFGGVDGAIEAIADRSYVSGLPDHILTYDIAKNQWRAAGTFAGRMLPRVNAPAMTWKDGYVIVSGEHLPARRTNAITRVHTKP